MPKCEVYLINDKIDDNGYEYAFKRHHIIRVVSSLRRKAFNANILKLIEFNRVIRVLYFTIKNGISLFSNVSKIKVKYDNSHIMSSI